MAVPIVGEPASILKWYGTVLMNCHCQREKGIISLVIVTGTGNSAACGNCGKIYIMRGYTIEKGVVNPVVDIALPTEPGKVM